MATAISNVNDTLAQNGNSMALVLAAQLQAEVQAQVIMAERNPRDWDQVREKLLRECKRTSFAEAARYNKPIGKGVEGFSIRFAEAAIQCAKHVHITVRTIYEDDEQRKIQIKVFDAQEGISYADEISIEKTIERRSAPAGSDVIRTRKNKNGDQLYILAATEDDLLNKTNAAKSKSIRNSGLRLIPGWLQAEALDLIKATVKSSDEKNPDAAKQKLFDSFGEVGVDVTSIKKFLGHDAGTLTPLELQTLRGLYAAIHDGETTMYQVLTDLEKERARDREKDAAAMKGAEGEVVGSAGGTVASVRDKILNREKKSAAPTTIDGSTSSPRGDAPGSAGTTESPTPQTNPKP
jgi:hypothetical protein